MEIIKKESEILNQKVIIPTENVWLTRITLIIFGMIVYICLLLL